MTLEGLPLVGLAVALGCGLLVGLERERRKGEGPDRDVAGLRTFTVAAMAGVLAAWLAEPWLVAAGLLAVAAVLTATLWRQRQQDPGLTTELALLATYLIGALALDRPMGAAVAALVLTGLLALRTRLHHFARSVLREEELHDLLLLGAIALLVMPLLPAQPLAWLGGVSARQLGGLVLVLLTLQGLAHVALRLLGSRAGWLASGLLGGLVSSTATVAALGAQARRHGGDVRAHAAAAVMSTAATWLQPVLRLWPLAPVGARAWPPVALAGLLLALTWGWWLAPAQLPEAAPAGRRPLRPREALLLAALLTGVTVAVSAAQHAMGNLGALGGAALAGLADAHAALPSLAGLAHEGRIQASILILGLLLALGANGLTRSVVAFTAGGAAYGRWVTGALVAQLLAAGAMAGLALA
ncbi:MAG: DUF4010 domain-containing protein [Inhella sp.]